MTRGYKTINARGWQEPSHHYVAKFTLGTLLVMILVALLAIAATVALGVVQDHDRERLDRQRALCEEVHRVAILERNAEGQLEYHCGPVTP